MAVSRTTNIIFVNKRIVFKGLCEKDIINTVIDYFDLDRDYNKIKSILENVDENMKESIKYGEGIRILNQDLWETIISFIISANNNIPRIKGIINRMSKAYGEEIEWKSSLKYFFWPCAWSQWQGVSETRLSRVLR